MFNDGVNGSQLLTPDQRITSVGYAMMAGNVPDGAITSTKLAPGVINATNFTANSIGSEQLANVIGLGDSNTLGRVMYATVPRVSLTPFGRSQSVGNRSLLQLLTDSFNDSMRRDVRINGRSLGFLNASQTFTNIVDLVEDDDSDPNGITNVSDKVCTTVSALDCTPTTLVSGGTFNNYLWADDKRFGYAGHFFLGDEAVNLATSLPW